MKLGQSYNYDIAQLAPHHNRKLFSCGVAALDCYLQQQANQDVKKNVAAVFVLTKKESPDVIGFYTLSSLAIDAGELPEEITKKLPKYPSLPATLLGRLAVDKQHQGKGLGGFLIINAIHRSLSLSREIASMAMVVDAKDEQAIAFYEGYGFIKFLQQPRRKLFLPMATAAKGLSKNIRVTK